MELTSEFFDSPEMRDVESYGTTKAGLGMVRQLLFLRLIAMTSEGRRFSSGQHFAKACSLKTAQCDAVWQFCMERGILRDDGDGFSANKWLESKSRENLRFKGPVLPSPCEYAGKPQNAPENANLAAIPPIPDPPAQAVPRPPRDSAMPVGKIAVRDNVHLTPSEIEMIKARYGAELFDDIVNELSSWKRATGRTYASDAAGIERWVAKKVQDRAKAGFDSESAIQLIDKAIARSKTK